MIKLAENRLINFIEFLNVNWPTEKCVYLTVLHNYDCVAIGEEKAWAVYKRPETIRDRAVIYSAGEVPQDVIAEAAHAGTDSKDIIFENMAHEYCHHMQHCRDRKPFPDEDIEKEAEEFAVKAMKIWHNSPKSHRGWRGIVASCTEWLEGCTCAEEGEPNQCEECTGAFLEHIKHIGKKDI